MYKASPRDHGTLTNLLHRIGRLPDAKDPKKNLNACLDEILAIFKGYMIVAACQELGISSPEDVPSQTTDKENPVKFKASDVARIVVDKWTIASESVLGQRFQGCDDDVFNYARVLCHLTALVLEFTDAWSEGDGPRIVCCWKVFMVHFFENGNTKYSLEALRLQCQLASLPLYLVHQLLWGRFVNTHGGKGHNIPCDLHNEHINKQFKEIVCNMGSNFTQSASTRAARSVSTLTSLAEKFDRETGIHPESRAHTRRSERDDVKSIVHVVQQNKIMTAISHREHTNFKSISGDPLKSLDRLKLNNWITKVSQYSKLLPTTECHESEQSDSDSNMVECEYETSRISPEH